MGGGLGIGVWVRCYRFGWTGTVKTSKTLHKRLERTQRPKRSKRRLRPQRLKLPSKTQIIYINDRKPRSAKRPKRPKRLERHKLPEKNPGTIK